MGHQVGVPRAAKGVYAFSLLPPSNLHYLHYMHHLQYFNSSSLSRLHPRALACRLETTEAHPMHHPTLSSARVMAVCYRHHF
jgi:hypothetical protein